MGHSLNSKPKSISPELQTFFIHTFGCQMNVNDSEHIGGLLQQEGLKPVSSWQESDLIIINTCAVRQKSEEKLFSLLGRLKPWKQKKKKILGVIGCVAQLRREEIFAKAPHVDFIVGPDNYHRLLELIKFEAKQMATNWHSDWYEISALPLRASQSSAYVTIMEGCNNFCAYCVVPFTRGREKYRPFTYILDEVKKLADLGYQEIHFLGQNVNSYRDQASGKDLVDILEKANQVSGLRWIRFITSHPRYFDQRLAKAMASLEKVCAQLHLPLQAGSNNILSLMNRGYTREEYLEKVAMIREYIPSISLSTDIIVGFPGEEEEDFQQTLEMLEKIKFDNIYSFRFSPRPRTAAAKLEDNVPPETKRQRLLEVQARQKEIQSAKHKTQVGQVMEVLCTGKSKKDERIFSGRNEAYQVINFAANEEVMGKFVLVKITDYGPYSLRGKMHSFVD